MKNNKEIKEAAFTYCKEFVFGRISRLKRQISEIETALTSETKSSAGDKHETGRAMLQLEREKIGVQLANAENMQGLLNKVRLDSPTVSIALGALVYTTEAKYYIAISAGEFKMGNEVVYCISPVTPVGKLLLGKKEDDEFTFNGKTHRIVAVY
ncbi:GreA/GreB family elongation factor [Maribacter thermophilus]|uniref:GreA/GreB family elongation factor n=1 Tax=Maribacter thermophilus TaxID=1197874 RepID=UPI0006410743|nr:GreA/GreB family elongation factor [Maribacter thermophilus]